MAGQVNQPTELDWVEEMPLDLVTEVIEWMEAQAPVSSEYQGEAVQDRATIAALLCHTPRIPAACVAFPANHGPQLVEARTLDWTPPDELAPDGLSCSTVDLESVLELHRSWRFAPDDSLDTLGYFPNDLTPYYQDATLQLPLQNTILDDSNDTPGARGISAVDHSAFEVNDAVDSETTLLGSVASQAAPTLAQVNSTESSSGARNLYCPYKNCSHDGSFRRQYELDRHILVKHKGEKPFSCTCLGCFKGQVAPAFARSDKLTAHIRTAHLRKRDAKFVCPDSRCDAIPLTLDLLGIHIQKRHTNLWHSEHLRAVLNAANLRRVPCPIWRCLETPPLKDLIPHLMQHDRHQLEDGEHELVVRNYSLDRDILLDYGHRKSGEASSASLHAIIGMRVLCPICKNLCDDHASFEDHFDTTHAIAASHRSHFESWRSYLHAENFSRIEKLSQPWKKNYVLQLDKYTVLQCPACDYVRSPSCPWSKLMDDGHHFDMLVDPEEIKPYRRELLWLYPDTATHPVWDDMK